MKYTNNQRGNIAAGMLIAVPVIFVLFFVFCFRTVDAGKVGIVTRFGEVNRVANSGIAIKLPWPIERLHKMDTRIQKQQEEASAATSDLQDVKATLALNYALNRDSALKVFKEIGGEYRDRVVIPAVQESFKAASAQYTASQLITERASVKEKSLDSIKKRLAPYGVRVDDLNIVNFSFSVEFTKALEAKQVAAQEAEKAKFEVERNRNLAEAAIASANGSAEANRIVRESLTSDLLQRQAIEKWDGKMPQYLGGGTVFNIPLQGR